MNVIHLNAERKDNKKIKVESKSTVFISYIHKI